MITFTERDQTLMTSLDHDKGKMFEERGEGGNFDQICVTSLMNANLAILATA